MSGIPKNVISSKESQSVIESGKTSFTDVGIVICFSDLQFDRKHVASSFKFSGKTISSKALQLVNTLLPIMTQSLGRINSFNYSQFKNAWEPIEYILSGSFILCKDLQNANA